MAVKTKAVARHKRFGERLRYWRDQRGMTQIALGQAMGWKTGSAINQMEQGTYNPTLRVIYRLSAVLEIAPIELFIDPEKSVLVNLDGLSPPLQQQLTALITNMKHECPRKLSA